MIFRKGNEHDCGAVYQLICELENKQLCYEDFSQIYRQQLESEHYYCLVCQAADEVVGILNLRFEKQLHHSEQIAEIMEFAVGAPHRNRGIGKNMFAQACRLARDAGCTQIELATNQLRKDAHRFYSREGMHNFHYKFTKLLMGNDASENQIGR